MPIIFILLFFLPVSLHAAENDERQHCVTLYYNQKEEAFDICRSLAENGDMEAEKILGDMYFWGWGDKISKNYDEAIKWYINASRKGHSEAKFNLGVIYEQGRGVPVDYNRAFKWYLSAANDGHMNSQFNVANMYDKGAGVEQDQRVAAKWYLRAAEQGDVEAQYNMGNRYAKSDGVGENLVEAYKWYLIAQNGGDADAAKNAEILMQNMTPEQIQEAKSLAELWRPKIDRKVE